MFSRSRIDHRNDLILSIASRRLRTLDWSATRRLISQPTQSSLIGFRIHGRDSLFDELLMKCGGRLCGL